ncbi:MAG: hypothetical protein QXF26_10405 [Candidatus Bathyarchaeia archaeon]
MAKEFWSYKSCKKGYNGYWSGRVRDRVVVDGDDVKYLLWGNAIANWNRRNSTLIVDDCGWNTKLTFDRLNSILGHVSMCVYNQRRKPFLRDMEREADYVWEGNHIINLENRQITPCTPKRFNEKASKALIQYYEKARKVVEKKKFLVTATLDGTVYAFVNSWYRRIESQVLSLCTFEDGFKAYKGMAATSKVYSAFTKNNATTLTNHLIKHGYQIEDARSVLRELKEFGVNCEILPEHVVSKLALTKLLEE